MDHRALIVMALATAAIPLHGPERAGIVLFVSC